MPRAGIGRESQEAYGLLRVTTFPDVAALVVAPLLPGFLARYPRVRLEIEATVRLVDLVAEGFDLGIRVTLGRLASSTLISKKLGRDEHRPLRRQHLRRPPWPAEAPRGS